MTSQLLIAAFLYMPADPDAVTLMLPARLCLTPCQILNLGLQALKALSCFLHHFKSSDLTYDELIT